MRIFLAGGTGVIGRALVPALRDAGHTVVATTRREDRIDGLLRLGADGVVVDALDPAALTAAVGAAGPDVVIHQLTDLSGGSSGANARLRTEGSRNLATAIRAARVRRVLAQSIAWAYADGAGPATEDTPLDVDAAPPRSITVDGVTALEQAMSESAPATILRYGTLYGPGTWYSRTGLHAEAARAGTWSPALAVTSFLHVDDAVAATVAALDWPMGPVNVVDDDPAETIEWAPRFAQSVGGQVEQEALAGSHSGRPVSNAHAHALGWRPRWSSWRNGFAAL
ncbi:NAD-dependent epimerase/dehydratase [Rhodococcus sp. RD6.2]|uniref:NAD-dependent epimerase/dehydratase family protein n=1 Tax=Rhodococcus sp. RD6.2 TaxID=260936 RepID=UPI00063B890D|nr:NAD(P)-dependent oxidoreductase [Rhodococcus sp. RD6.2]CRK52172.1 NAD-dependent epimerase/dehydratase [Rhodococcus sp. RD6.2]